MDRKIIADKALCLAQQIRANFSSNSHPKYGLHLVYACWQARLCGYQRIMAVEMGVAGGGGIKALDYYSKLCHSHLGIKIEIVGFDTGQGLPRFSDYRDHPEIWTEGEYGTRLSDERIIYGDVKDTLPSFINSLNSDTMIGFVILDLDLYSSTKSALSIFEQSPSHYLPAVLVHLDDTNTHLTLNPWCGAELALREFNDANTHRKFEQKHRCWNIDNMYVLHVLDHPLRQGHDRPAFPIECFPL